MGKKPAKKAKRPKRPSVPFSKCLFEEMLMEIVEGKTLRAICAPTNRPSCPTFLKWIHQDDDLFKQYMRAREMSGHLMADEVRELEGITNPDNAAAHRVRFEMKKWDIGRRAPKIFGDKQTLEHTGEGGGPVQEIRRIIVRPDHGSEQSGP